MVRGGIADHHQRICSFGHLELCARDLAPGQEGRTGRGTAVRAVAVERYDELVRDVVGDGVAFLPWGEIERTKLKVTKGADSLMVIGNADADHAIRCSECGSLLYWTVRDGTSVRVPYGSLIDEPALKPTAHIFVGSKAPWHEILDDLPQHDEYQ